MELTSHLLKYLSTWSVIGNLFTDHLGNIKHYLILICWNPQPEDEKRCLSCHVLFFLFDDEQGKFQLGKNEAIQRHFPDQLILIFSSKNHGTWNGIPVTPKKDYNAKIISLSSSTNLSLSNGTLSRQSNKVLRLGILVFARIVEEIRLRISKEICKNFLKYFRKLWIERQRKKHRSSLLNQR